MPLFSYINQTGRAPARSSLPVVFTYFLRVLRSHDGHLGHTGAVLGISRPTLRARMKKYGLQQKRS